jgi:hypothetical protein
VRRSAIALVGIGLLAAAAMPPTMTAAATNALLPLGERFAGFAVATDGDTLGEHGGSTRPGPHGASNRTRSATD